MSERRKSEGEGLTRRLTRRLLGRNVSVAQIAAFLLSNLIGLAIVVAGIQVYFDSKPLWGSDDSVLTSDFMVLNKRVSGVEASAQSNAFTEEEIAELDSQPWVRKVGRFSSNNFKAFATMGGQRGMSSYIFFEALPDEFIDVADGRWHYTPGQAEIPLIISKDYLTLYNFGFAGSAGLPQMSENVFSSIPMELEMRSEDGRRLLHKQGRVVGFSNRLNTILVPQSFMEEANGILGNGGSRPVSRVAVDISRPGDAAIAEYLQERGWEAAGDRSSSKAAFLVRVIVGIVVSVGGVITALSLLVLLLSLSLLISKNREKIHSLLMLGVPMRTVAAPYLRLTVWVCGAAYLLSLCAWHLLRQTYLPALESLGCVPEGHLWEAPLAGLVISLATVLFNAGLVNRKVMQSRYK